MTSGMDFAFSILRQSLLLFFLFTLPPLALLAAVVSQAPSWKEWATQGSSYLFGLLAVLHFPHFWLCRGVAGLQDQIQPSATCT